MTIGDKRITRETAHGEKLILFPKSEGEAARLQEKLLAMGFPWADGNTAPAHLEKIQKYGLVLQNGIIYYNTPGNNTRYETCRLDQVGEVADPILMPRDDVRAMFDAVATRLDALGKRLENIETHLELLEEGLSPAPAALDKKKLRFPGPNSGQAR
jgi:hypothetical protein